METNGAGKNGSAKLGAYGLEVVDELATRAGQAEPAPERVRDLADACVRFVERAVGVKLDYEPETLSLLDHYLVGARAAAAERPEAGALVAHAAGAYFGEVVRRRYPSWWRFEGDDPGDWRIELQPVYLAFRPVQLVADALFRARATGAEGAGTNHSTSAIEAAGAAADAHADEAAGADEDPRAEDPGSAEGASERLEMEEEDRRVVAARLAELPEVSEDEFYALSTRLEVIDIAVEAIRGRRLADGDGDSMLGPDDYEPAPS